MVAVYRNYAWCFGAVTQAEKTSNLNVAYKRHTFFVYAAAWVRNEFESGAFLMA